MSLLDRLNSLQDAPAPDFVTRPAIAAFVANARKQMAVVRPGAEKAFAEEMAARPVAEYTEAANAQHYELPARFFELALGPNRKYSSAFYDHPSSTLAEAEVSALRAALAARAPDDVVNRGRIELVALGEGLQHGGCQLLRVDMSKGALANFANAARCAAGVDNIGFSHVGFSRFASILIACRRFTRT